jgi:hypothetical protein
LANSLEKKIKTILAKSFAKLFPRIKTTYPRNKQTGKQETAYQYIEFRGEEQAEAVTLTIENITNYIPKHCAVLLHMNRMNLPIRTKSTLVLSVLVYRSAISRPRI